MAVLWTRIDSSIARCFVFLKQRQWWILILDNFAFWICLFDGFGRWMLDALNEVETTHVLHSLNCMSVSWEYNPKYVSNDMSLSSLYFRFLCIYIYIHMSRDTWWMLRKLCRGCGGPVRRYVHICLNCLCIYICFFFWEDSFWRRNWPTHLFAGSK